MSWPTWRELYRFGVEGLLAYLGLLVLGELWDDVLCRWRRRRGR